MAEHRFDLPAGERIVACRSCGARIVWTVTAAGKRMPLSIATLRTDEDGRQTCESHFADCPNAKTHRKPPEPQP